MNLFTATKNNATKKSADRMITEEQKKFIEYKGKDESIILSATAGSGKTTSCVERLKFLLKNKVHPSKIIFFSFTNAAVDELKIRIDNPDIKITTIHSFCSYILHKAGKYKPIMSFYNFIDWYKNKNKPTKNASPKDKSEFYEKISNLYDDADVISSTISSYKLQKADGIKSRLPDYFFDYCDFMKEKKGRDFSDMLIEVRNMLKEEKWLRMFRNKYDHIFIDEYQDTSVMQTNVLLCLNAKHYYLIGDISQSIFDYSAGVSAKEIEKMLKKRRKVLKMTLSKNFRSGKDIVDNGNKYSNIKAIPHHDFDGEIIKDTISFEKLHKMFVERNGDEIVVLARTNAAIKELEFRLMLKKTPIRYFNYFSKDEIQMIKDKEELRYSTKGKLSNVLPAFGKEEDLVNFIDGNSENKSFITTIHKSKGREFDTVVVVNSLSSDIIKYNMLDLTKKELKFFSFDESDPEDFESRNIHYVAITRPKKELYYMLYRNVGY